MQAVVYLSDGTIRLPHARWQDWKIPTWKGRDKRYFAPAVVHDPENTGDKPFDAIVIELKGGGAAAHAKPAATPATTDKTAKK